MIASRGYPSSISGQASQIWYIEGRRGQYVELDIQVRVVFEKRQWYRASPVKSFILEKGF